MSKFVLILSCTLYTAISNSSLFIKHNHIIFLPYSVIYLKANMSKKSTPLTGLKIDILSYNIYPNVYFPIFLFKI